MKARRPAPGPSSDFGPVQRRRHGLVVDAVGIDPAGLRVVHARELEACALDHLLRIGALTGPGETAAGPATRRHAAGLWLRGCHQAAGLQPVRAIALDRVSRGTAGEISDAEAMERRAFNQALRAIGQPLARLVEAVACFDTRPAPEAWPPLRRGLGRLADWRGL